MTAIVLAVSVIALIFVLFDDANEAADNRTAVTPVENAVYAEPIEEPKAGPIIYDSRVETIEIAQSPSMGTGGVVGQSPSMGIGAVAGQQSNTGTGGGGGHRPDAMIDETKTNRIIAGKETALVVTFIDAIDQVFSEGIPLCYISVYKEGGFLTQIAASGLYYGRDLFIQPKSIVETGNWAEGSYTFELYLGDNEGAVAAILTADFQNSPLFESPDNEDPREDVPIDSPEDMPLDFPVMLNEQDEIPEVKMSEGIRFDALIYDFKDGLLTGSKVLWTLGGKEYQSGSSLWIWPYELPPGIHTFTCTATNSEGLSSRKDFIITVTEDESDLPEGRSREEIADALSKGLVAPLNRLEVPVSRGQFANQMAEFYDAFSGRAAMNTGYITDDFNYFGRDDRSQSIMARLGAMEAQNGYFEPNKSLTEEEAALIMCKVVALSIPGFFGAEDEAGIMTALSSYGIFDEYVYQANEKLTQKLALIRLSRLYDAVASDELRIIAERFKPYECDDAAYAMRADLIKGGKNGSIINLYYPAQSNVFAKDPVSGSVKVSTTGIHVGVLFAGQVHCNIFPKGLPEQEWLESFFETSGRDPWIEYLPF